MQNLTVEIFNTEGDVLGEDVIPYNEVNEYYDKVEERRVAVIELQAKPKAHPDDVSAALDLIYGYFKWQKL